MTAIFKEYLFSFVLIFLDNFLVFGKSEEEHKEHRIVFEDLWRANLKLKPKKCKIYQNSVTYLAYKLSAEGILPDEGKFRALKSGKDRKTLQKCDRSLDSAVTIADL